MQLNIIDYIIIAVLAFSALVGLKKGLFLVVGGLVGLLVGLLAAIAFHKELAIYLEHNWGIETWLTNFLQDKLFLQVLNQDIPKTLGHEYGWTDPASILASSFIIALSFLLILVLGRKLVQIIGYLLDFLLARGILSGVNRSLGLVLMVGQNLILMTVVVGLLLPPLEMLADIGIPGAIVTTTYLQGSALLEQLLKLFAYINHSLHYVQLISNA